MEYMSAYSDNPDIVISAILIQANTKENLGIAKASFPGKFPHTCSLPCGSSITFENIDDIPLHDIPCSCGRSNHYFVRVVILDSENKKVIE